MDDDRGHTVTTGAGGPAPTLSVPCTGPGTPHPEDTVTFLPEISNDMGFACMYAIRDVVRNGSTEDDARGRVAKVFLHFGITGWNKVGPPDKEGKREPEPVTPGSIDRLLPFAKGGMEAIDFANTLYSGDLLVPLAAKSSTPSEATQTDDSTSPPTPSGLPEQKASKRSSPAASAGTPSNG